MKKNITLKNKILQDNNLSDNAICVYTALMNIYHFGQDNYYINYNLLAFQLFGNSNFTRYDVNNIKNGFNQLIDKNIISIVEELGKNEFMVNLPDFYVDKDKDYRLIAEGKDIETIFNLCNVNKFALLRYYLTLLSTVHFKTTIEFNGKDINNFVGFMTQDYICELTNISKKVILNYNTLLEENKLIYIYRHNKKVLFDDGNIKTLGNQYGKYKNKEYIEHYAVYVYEDKHYSIINKDSDDNKIVKDNQIGRSLSAKYNAMLNGKVYDIETIKEIYFYIKANNEKYSKDEYYKDKIKDLSIFDKYNFDKDTTTLLSDADIWGSDDTMTSIDDTENNIDIEEYFADLHSKLHHISPSVQIAAQMEFDKLNEVSTNEI